MRDLVVTENITLDGVIDATEGWFTVGNDAVDDESDILAELMGGCLASARPGAGCRRTTSGCV
ncbi:hypothetical protein APR12_002307 [Nocardia amikacinitolerans]|uniref:hypothetical protein n=1 Tax=Nocardia amikacinitolerans TaxID=756689 RepID=UPI000AE3D2BD|nr:hypothetical protein [Nocardia amikacinitolerans]MCP2316967.1 hypothetical protein [Nocardia amikacinitolerans]